MRNCAVCSGCRHGKRKEPHLYLRQGEPIRCVADMTESTRCKKVRCCCARRPQWPQREEACENATQPLLSSE
eukprot:6742808-Pyramimonas_sp.AAC.1